MEVLNETPFPTETERESLPEQPIGKLVAYTKVTYDLDHSGTLSIAREQLPIFREPCEEAPMGEMHYWFEPQVVDITVMGTVRTINARPCRSMDVKLFWGSEVRTIRVFGERMWRKNNNGRLMATEPEPFTELPMRWEFAYGGKQVIPAGFAPDSQIPMPSGESVYAANPKGMGFGMTEDQVDGLSLPHFEDPENLIKDWRDKPTPICFAPLPSESLLRAQHIDLDPETGRLSSKHGDQEMLFARCTQNAPPALQVKGLVANTLFRLEGMTKDSAFQFSLPAPPLVWQVELESRTTSIKPSCAAVQLLPDMGKIAVLCRANVYYPLIRYEHRKAKLVFIQGYDLEGAIPGKV